MATNIGTAYGAVDIDLSGLDRAVKQARAGMDQIEKSVEGAGRGVSSSFDGMRGRLEAASASLLQTGAALSVGVSAPLAMIGKQALTTAMDYEQAMNLFQATTGATEEQMERMGQRAKELGADMALPGASAADAAEVMLELGKAGLSVEEAMEEARGAMALAATEGINNADAAMIAAGAYNTFRAEGLKVAEVADILAAGSNASSASVRSLAEGLQQGGSAFAAANVPMRDLVAQMSLMANAGIQGSDAGTSLKTMLQRLQAPTKDATASLAELGISIYDGQGAMRPMRDLVSDFSDRLSGLTQEQRDAAIITIFGADAQRAANIVLAGGVEQYDQMYEAVGRSGAASELAGARMQGLAGAIEGFKSTVETALLEAVEPFLPALASLVTAAADAVGAFGDLPEPVRNAAVAFAAVLAAAGPVVLAIGGLTAAATAVSAPVLVAVGALAALTAALASGEPVIIGATTAIAAYLAVQQFGAVSASIAAISAQTAALWANAGAALAASGPFVVLAAAVAGATYVYQKWQNVASDAAQKWLDQNEQYQASVRALDRYSQASGKAQAATSEQAEELRRLQAEQERDIQLRAEAAEAGDKDAAWWEESNRVNKERIIRMGELSAALEENLGLVEQGLPLIEEQATAEEQAAQATQRASAAQLAASGDIYGALALMREAAGLTEDQFKTLSDQLEDAATRGAEAFGSVVATEAGFYSEREGAASAHEQRLADIRSGGNEQAAELLTSHNERLTDLHARLGEATTDKERARIRGQIAEEKQSYAERLANLDKANADKLAAEEASFAEQERKAAESYARQQAEQLAHLGQMLIQYVTAQAEMAGISGEAIDEMTRKLADQYGVQQSLADQSFGAMKGNLDAWVANGGQNTDRYISDLGRITDETVTLQRETDRIYGEMIAQAREDFANGKIDIDQYAERLTKIPGAARDAAESLLGIPTRIDSTVTITTVRAERTESAGTGGAGNRTTGGGVSGTRALGGPVKPNSMYEVAEGGTPELLTMGGRTYLMTGAEGGSVIPAIQALGAAAGQLASVGGAAMNSTARLVGGTGSGLTISAPVSITLQAGAADLSNPGLQERIAAVAQRVLHTDLAEAITKVLQGGYQ